MLVALTPAEDDVDHGDRGGASSSVCFSPLTAPGSRNEKKLCDRECLWWCPRREEVPPDSDLDIAGGCGAFVAGGRPPKVKFAPSGVVGARAERAALGRLYAASAEGIVLTGASALPVPSSSIVESCERVPGRGKKTERLRECMRPWRRDCVGEMGLVGSGFDAEEVMAGGRGNEVERGEGDGGEYADMERPREWELAAKFRRGGVMPFIRRGTADVEDCRWCWCCEGVERTR